MSFRSLADAPATYEGLTEALKFAPPYLRPILESVRDFHVGMLFVGQCDKPFRLPKEPGRPAIIIIGDDFDRAVGPAGFHMPSVRRAIRACDAFAIVSSCPQEIVYASIAVTASASRRNVMLIETRPEQEIPWLALIQKLAPRRHVWLATVKGGHA